ncbi:MAG: hypothetical protein ACRENA_04430 [Vulcanimicrobiaceae bacterium]
MIWRKEVLDRNMKMRPAISGKPRSQPKSDDPNRKIEGRIAWRRVLHLAVCAFVASGCAPAPKTVPQNVSVGDAFPASWPTPLAKPVDAEPQIQAMRFSSLNVPLGTDWNGDVVASTNTASIEVLGTNLFSFSVPKTGVGAFHFNFHMIDVPSFFVRPYSLHVIARNTAGEKSEIDVPFRISGRR